MKNLILLPVFLFFTCPIIGQIDTTWARLWDSQYWDEAHAITTDESNNIYIAGWAYEWGTNYDFVFSKYNAAGNLQWVKIRNYAITDQATHILYDQQGTIYIGGFVNGTTGTIGGSICLMKYSADGDSIWEFVDTHTSLAQLTSMKFDNQGNIILAGYESIAGTNLYDYVTMKIDAAGNQLWYKTYTTTGIYNVDKLWDMCVDADNYIYVTGQSDAGPSSYFNIATIKYKPDGDTVWMKKFYGSADTSCAGKRILVDQDKNVYIGGNIMTQVPLGNDIVLLKYDSSANLIFAKYYNYQPATLSVDMLVDMKMDHDGNIYITGTSSSTGSSSTKRILTIKFTDNGDTLWTRRWGAPGEKFPQQLAIDNMANIYSAGSYWSTSGGGFDAVILKYNAVGQLIGEASYNYGGNLEQGFYDLTLDQNNDIIASGRTQTSSTMDFLIVKYHNSITGVSSILNHQSQLSVACYPNPIFNSTLINYKLEAAGYMTLKIYDLFGNEVSMLEEGRMQAGDHSHQFIPKGLTSGIYFLRLMNNGNQITRKIIIR